MTSLHKGVDVRLPGEHPVDVQPALQPRPDATWRQRRRWSSGRAVTDRLLAAEQAWRAGHLALLGRCMSPGVVSGLDVEPDGDGLLVSPGVALTAFGEVVHLTSATRALLVRTPPPGELPPVTGLLDPPRAGAFVLVAEPVSVESHPDADPSDPCPDDPTAEAYARRALVDGVRLTLHALDVTPDDLALDDPALRDRLAWRLLDAELDHGTRDGESLAFGGAVEPSAHPWEGHGVGLALVVTDAAGGVRFVDGAAVARRGGRVLARRGLVGGLGRPAVWQARLDWFQEALLEHLQRGDPTADPTPVAARWFTRLPPVGLIPVDLLQPRAGVDRFFPDAIRPVARPIPLSHVDAVIAAAAALAPIDLAGAAAVEALVVVPDAVYEPALLRTEVVDPIFEATLAELRATRADLLWQRGQVRRRLAALEHAAGGPDAVTPWPERDEGAADDEIEGVGLSRGATLPDGTTLLPFDETPLAGAIKAVREAPGGLDGLTALIDALAPDAEGAQALRGAAALAVETGRTSLRLLPGAADAVAAGTWAARVAAPWMLDDPTEPTATRDAARVLLFDGAITTWETLAALVAEPAEADRLLVLAGEVDEDVLRALRTLPVLWRAERRRGRGPLVLLPPEGVAAGAWLQPIAELLSWQVQQGERPFTPGDLVHAGVARVDAAGLTLDPGPDRQGALGPTPGPVLVRADRPGDKQPELRRLRLGFLADLVGRVLTDPALVDGDDLWRDAAALQHPIEAEAGVAWSPDGPGVHGGRVSVDLLALGARLEAPDAGLGTAQASAVFDLGVGPFAADLDARRRRAESSLDLHFAGAQAAIYAVRQAVLGTDEATRTTTSPVLTRINLGTTAVAERADVKAFASVVREAGAVQTATTAPAGGAAFAALRQPSPALKGGLTSLRASRNAAAAVAGAARASTLGKQEAIGVQPPSLPFLRVTPPTTFRYAVDNDAADALRGFDAARSPGVQYEYGRTGVSQRLADPTALLLHERARAVRADVTTWLATAELHLDDVAFPGFVGTDPVQGRTGEPVELLADRYGLRLVAGDLGLAREIIAGLHDADVQPGQTFDEALFTQSALRHLENAIQGLRLAEGRADQYARAADLARALLRPIQQAITLARARLAALDELLAEVRHDVGVALALLAEETARVAAINQRRDAVMAEHVDVVLFHHLRSGAWAPDTARVALEPVLLRDPVPECLRRDVVGPPELRALLDAWREAPVAWFPRVKVELKRHLRLDDARNLVAKAKDRRGKSPSAPKVAARPGPSDVGKSLQRAFDGTAALLDAARRAVLGVDLARVRVAPLIEVVQTAQDVLTLGDVLDGDGVSGALRKRALQEIDDVEAVASCTWEAFGRVPAALRLGWATTLSQHDDRVDLTRLSILPGWASVPSLLRQELQAHVDWLAQRVDRTVGDARALIDDLVRAAILLASYAPIDAIVAGTVDLPAETPLRPGLRLPLAIDPRLLRAGMSVQVLRGVNVVGRADVDDVHDAGAVAVVRQVFTAVTLLPGDRVEVVEPGNGAARVLRAGPKAARDDSAVSFIRADLT